MNEHTNKVAQITTMFWVMKICATTLGETAGDLLSMTLGVGYALSSILLLSVFLLSLIIQLSLKSFRSFPFWLVILTTSIAGTTMSDFIDRSLGFGYALGSSILAAILICILFVWFLSERSLSVVCISSRKNEIFYWMAILVSNTLGTALGDYLADDSGLGFTGSAFVITSIMLVIVLFYVFVRGHRILLFWLAFVLTRPLGATLGDLMTKDHEQGGLGFGTTITSAILFLTLIVLIFRESYATSSKSDKLSAEPTPL